jgi:hypothetical protein
MDVGDWLDLAGAALNLAVDLVDSWLMWRDSWL